MRREGARGTQTHAGGRRGRVRRGGPPRRHGTTVTFWADPAIFETTVYSFETLSRRIQEMAFLNRGLAISLTDERESPPTVVHYQYKGGIEDFVRHLNATKEPIHKSVIGFGEDGVGMAVR